MFRLLAVSLAVTLSLGFAAPASAQHFPSDAELQGLLKSRVESGRAKGLVVGLLEADGTERVVAFGSGGEGTAPLDAESVFEIGSITKVFTGILLAEMSLRGDLAMKQALQEFIPEIVRVPRRPGQEIRLVDLATHHSGLPRLPHNLNPSDPANPYAEYTVEMLYEFIGSYRMTRDIGLEYEYSNLGVGLLGQALANRQGGDYGWLLQQRVLEPLGMSSTGIAVTPEMKPHLTRGHDAEGKEVPYWEIPGLAGAGALRSNAKDMLRFLKANLAEPTTPLGRAMRLSHEPRADGPGDNQVGLCWHILSVGEARLVWHNGGTGGYRAFAGFDPDARVAVVVLSNSSQDADDLGLHLLNGALPLAEAPGEKAVTEER